MAQSNTKRIPKQWSELSPQERVHVYLHMMGIAPYPEIVEAFTATCMYAGTPRQVDRVGELVKPLATKTPFWSMQEDLYDNFRAKGIKYQPLDTGGLF